MPFTLSHAAAVLPTVRRDGTARGPLLTSALVAGSFAPDLTYYADSVVPGGMAYGEFTHSPAGVLTVDTLLAALLVGGWLLLREPLLALLPERRRGRVAAALRGRDWHAPSPGRLLVRFWLSAALGALTHIVWDAFTHPGRWGVRLLPVLQETAGGFPLYTYVQYGTSAVALAAIGWFLYAVLRRTPRVAAAPDALPEPSRRARLLTGVLLGLCALLGAVHRVLRAREVFGTTATWFDYVPTVLFGAGAGLAIGLPLWAAAARLRHRRRTPHGRPGPEADPEPERATAGS